MAMIRKPGQLFVSPASDLAQRHPLLTWTANSPGVGLTSTTVSLIIATLAGYSLSR
jgi:ABC-type glycerol-3-phosphate transport system permease component